MVEGSFWKLSIEVGLGKELIEYPMQEIVYRRVR